MQFLWSIFISTIVLVQFIECGVVMRKRPFPFHERSNARTTTATTTTTTEETIYEENEDSAEASNRFAHLTLPSNATSIRSDITDTFSCAGRIYGYYADVDNDCQIFHVCLPVTYPDGREQEFRWSFICPEETTFSQEAFTCVRTDELNNDCSDSEKFYELNRILGLKDETIVEEVNNNDIYHGNGKTINKHNENNRRGAAPIEPVQQFTTSANYYRTPIAHVPVTAPTNNNFYNPSSVSTYQITANTKTLPHENQAIVEGTSETIAIPLDADESTTSSDITTSNYNVDRSPEPLYTRFPVRGSYTTVRNDLNTRIVPDLNENGLDDASNDQLTVTDEVIDSIKQLQNILPSDDDDLRAKRILHQNDSIRTRFNLFDALNNH